MGLDAVSPAVTVSTDPLDHYPYSCPLRGDLTAALPTEQVVIGIRRPPRGHRPWCLYHQRDWYRGAPPVFAFLDEETHAWIRGQGIQRYTIRRVPTMEGGELRIRFRNRRDLALWTMAWC